MPTKRPSGLLYPAPSSAGNLVERDPASRLRLFLGAQVDDVVEGNDAKDQ